METKLNSEQEKRKHFENTFKGIVVLIIALTCVLIGGLILGHFVFNVIGA